MSDIAKELRDTADIAEAGNKPHWAKLMRCAAAQLIAGDEENALLLEENKRLEHEACANVDDAMIDSYMDFAKKTTHLHHPAVPYNGTINGDSQDAWMRRLVKALLEHAIMARVNK